MFVVIYSFQVKEGAESDFVSAWKEMTQMIYDFEGSYGSRLHYAGNGKYIAYAQWPSRERWEASGDKLTAESVAIRDRMTAACEDMDVVYQLDTVADLLKIESKN
jgi:heme-degrading monooxygenase HmoA